MASGVPQRDFHSRMTWSRIDQIEAASKGLRDELRRELGLYTLDTHPNIFVFGLKLRCLRE
jgi:hypothetical protein